MTINRLLNTTACLLLGFASVAAQQINVSKNVQVSLARKDKAHNETLIAADTNNADHLLGVSMALSVGWDAMMHTLVYTSFDRGKTWSLTLDTSAEPGFSGDPACAFGPDGAAYFSAIFQTPGKPGVLRVYRSKDGGKTWLEPVVVPALRGLDRQYIAVDDTNGKYRGQIYVVAQTPTYTVGNERGVLEMTLFRSTDSGASFTMADKRSPSGPRPVFHPGNNVVFSDGTTANIFIEITVGVNDDGTPGTIVMYPDRPNSAVKMSLSDDGGETLGPAVKISDQYVSWPAFGVSTMPYLAVDRGSKSFKDRLYAIWPDSRSGRSEVLFSYSADRGKTWSKPKTINDDRPFPDGTQGPDDYLPVVAVNQKGVVGVTWYDRRNSPDNLGWNLRFSASVDGGDTFSPSVLVSEGSTVHQKDRWIVRGKSFPAKTSGATMNINLTHAAFTFSAGHTAGLAADAAGTFHPFWVDNRTGVPQIWTSAIDVNGEVIPNGSTSLATLSDLSNNTLIEFSNFNFDAAKNELMVDARVKNTSKETITGPLEVRLITLRSELAQEVILVNSDNGLTGAGAVLDLTNLLPSGRLQPGETSTGKRLTFRFTDFRPLRQGREFKTAYASFVNAEVRVLGKVETVKP